MFSFDEPSALLSNARSTIATLIQRPSAITTSNAFDEFSILDHLIDVCNDVDRFEDGENRKFVNIAQLITASTCIYSRRVDALYKLLNTFQCSSSDKSEETEIIPILEHSDENSKKTNLSIKKKKFNHQQQSFICQDTNKINLNPSKTFFIDRTSIFDFQLFRNYVPIGNKQFWINDHRPIIFNLLFHDQILDNIQTISSIEPLNNHHLSPNKNHIMISDNDIPLPFPVLDEHQSSLWHNECIIEQNQIFEKKKSIKINREKKFFENDRNLNIFRYGLTDEQQTLFHLQKFKSSNNKTKNEIKKYFQKNFNRKHFENLIQDCPTKIIYPLIVNHYFSIRERYSIKIDRIEPIHSSIIQSEHVSFSYSSTYLPLDDHQDDMDIHLQTDMEQFLDAAITNFHEENEIFIQIRSSISNYLLQHQSFVQTNIDDLIDILSNQYSLPLIFSQLLHICASTQGYYLHSTDKDDLYLEKIL